MLITGPWHDISYKPDLAGLLGDAAKDPVGAARGLLDGLRSGSGDPAATPPAPGAASPRDAIRGLLNR